MMGRHKLIIPEFFTYVNHCIKTRNKELARLLASVAEACHENLLRDDVKDVLGTIVDNLVSENCSPECITMGLNAIREICLRMPHLLDKDGLAYLVQFKDYKNRYVSMAAKSLINLYRDIGPELLPNKLKFALWLIVVELGTRPKLLNPESPTSTARPADSISFRRKGGRTSSQNASSAMTNSNASNF
jgi:hypothetical protein